MSFEHLAFQPYRPLIDALGLDRGPPDLSELTSLARRLGCVNANGKPLRFVAAKAPLSACEYESGIFETGCVPTRADNWHDVMNALVWLRFPHSKSAINAGHVAALSSETGTTRGARRDALTLLDESGVVVTSHNPALVGLLIDRKWHELFWIERAQVVDAMTFIVVGHALLEKALAPYPAMTGKCLLLNSDRIDPQGSSIVEAMSGIASPRQLPPLPIQGIPGWDAANARADYYANREVFRPR